MRIARSSSIWGRSFYIDFWAVVVRIQPFDKVPIHASQKCLHFGSHEQAAFDTSQSLRVELHRCRCVELAFKIAVTSSRQSMQAAVVEPDVLMTQSVCCVINLPGEPVSFKLNTQGCACISICADRGDAVAVPDK